MSTGILCVLLHTSRLLGLEFMTFTLASLKSTIMDALNKIEAAVEREASAVTAGTRQAVAHEALADWLMRCPINFPEVATHEQN